MSEPRRRGWPARIGIALLNLLAPGLGLLRLGDLRRALGLIGAYVLLVVAFLGLLSAAQDMSFAAYFATLICALVGTLAICVVAIWWTVRESVWIVEQRPVYARWYSVALIAIISVIACNLLTYEPNRPYRSFYIPSETMEPTLFKNDKFIASMRPSADVRRGDLVLLRAPTGGIYLKRIAAIAGDTIALKKGIVFIDGAAVSQTPHGTRAVSYPYIEAHEAKVYLERFPGEARPHLIQDLGPSTEDDFPAAAVAPGHVFVLGDNRDDSADSRLLRDLGGLEQVPMSDILGHPLFLYWPASKMGQSLGR